MGSGRWGSGVAVTFLRDESLSDVDLELQAGDHGTWLSAVADAQQRIATEAAQNPDPQAIADSLATTASALLDSPAAVALAGAGQLTAEDAALAVEGSTQDRKM